MDTTGLEIYWIFPFPRVRVGIGRPENESVQVYEHVLSKFREEERGEIDKAVEKAAAAVVDILRFGVDDAIARQNGNVPKKKNKNKGGGDGTKKLKVKGGQPVAVAFKVSEDGEKSKWISSRGLRGRKK